MYTSTQNDDLVSTVSAVSLMSKISYKSTFLKSILDGKSQFDASKLDENQQKLLGDIEITPTIQEQLTVTEEWWNIVDFDKSMEVPL